MFIALIVTFLTKI